MSSHLLFINIRQQMLITVQPDPNWQLSLAKLSPSLFWHFMSWDSWPNKFVQIIRLLPADIVQVVLISLVENGHFRRVNVLRHKTRRACPDNKNSTLQDCPRIRPDLTVCEQLTKLKGSTDTCQLFHFLFVWMLQYIIKEDNKLIIELSRRKTTKKLMKIEWN